MRKTNGINLSAFFIASPLAVTSAMTNLFENIVKAILTLQVMYEVLRKILSLAVMNVMVLHWRLEITISPFFSLLTGKV